MRRIDLLVAWLDGLPHRFRKGHHPIWYLLGNGERYCVNCSRGGGPGGAVRLLLPKPLH